MSEILRGHGIEVLETEMGDLVDVAKYDELRKRLSDAALVEVELREELAAIRAATVEECAKVCEEFHDRYGRKQKFERASGATICFKAIQSLITTGEKK